jgi:hypothetical protein
MPNSIWNVKDNEDMWMLLLKMDLKKMTYQILPQQFLRSQ